MIIFSHYSVKTCYPNALPRSAERDKIQRAELHYWFEALLWAIQLLSILVKKKKKKGTHLDYTDENHQIRRSYEKLWLPGWLMPPDNENLGWREHLVVVVLRLVVQRKLNGRVRTGRGSRVGPVGLVLGVLRGWYGRHGGWALEQGRLRVHHGTLTTWNRRKIEFFKLSKDWSRQLVRRFLFRIDLSNTDEWKEWARELLDNIFPFDQSADHSSRILASG